MSSSSIVSLFRASMASVCGAILIALLCLTARAQSSQMQPTVLKVPASPAEAAHSSATLHRSVTKVGLVTPSRLTGQSTGSGKSAVDGLELLTPAQLRIFRRAASAFTPFCHEWERLLHDREVNNLEHLSWRETGGVETATYTGYGKVETCECKASKEGLPIGKIRYAERNYSVAGKTIDEARHAAPKLTHEISTLEIFSWDKGKWFY